MVMTKILGERHLLVSGYVHGRERPVDADTEVEATQAQGPLPLPAPDHVL